MKSFFGSLLQHSSSSSSSSTPQQPSTQVQPSFAPHKPPKQIVTLAAKNPKYATHWLQAVAVLKFDLEKGSVVEHLYPPLADVMHAREEKDLTSLAFPESNSL